MRRLLLMVALAPLFNSCTSSVSEVHQHAWQLERRVLQVPNELRRQVCVSSGSTAFVSSNGSILSMSGTWKNLTLTHANSITLELPGQMDCQRFSLSSIGEKMTMIDAIAKPDSKQWVVLVIGDDGESSRGLSNWSAGLWKLLLLTVERGQLEVIDQGSGLFPILNDGGDQFSYITSDGRSSGDAVRGHTGFVRRWTDPRTVARTYERVWGLWVDDDSALVLRDPKGRRSAELIRSHSAISRVATDVAGPNAVSFFGDWVLYFDDHNELILRNFVDHSSMTVFGNPQVNGDPVVTHVGGMMRVDQGFTFSTESRTYLLVLRGHEWVLVLLDGSNIRNESAEPKHVVRSAGRHVLWYQDDKDGNSTSDFFNPSGYFVADIETIARESRFQSREVFAQVGAS